MFAKNKPVESTDRKDGLPDATTTDVSSQNTNEGSDSIVENHKFQDVWKSEFLWLIKIIYDYSLQDQILLTKPNLLLERKSLNVKVC